MWEANVRLRREATRCSRCVFRVSLTRARQVVFVFFLHLFTGRAQRAVYQSVRGEGFEENAFTCSVADFAVGEVGRVAREIRGKCWKKWDFSVAGWGELREGR